MRPNLPEVKMDAETAGKALEAIRSSQCMNPKRELYLAALRYAHLRATWRLASQEERRAVSPARTAAHDALIECCDTLAQSMKDRGESADWREILGRDRREIGDFACYLHCLFGLSAR